MTKELPMTNDEGRLRESVAVSSLVIRVLTGAIRLYQLTISPAQTFLFGSTGGCRFTPTCSQYAVDAIRSRGAIAGSWLAAKRICRCHPFGKCGHDPVKTDFLPLLAKRGEGLGEESNNFQIPSPRPSPRLSGARESFFLQLN